MFMENIIIPLCKMIIYHLCLILGDQERSDADRRAASQACGDSMNSYAHSGMNRTPGSVLNDAHLMSEKRKGRSRVSNWSCVVFLTDTTATSEYTQEVYQGSKWVHCLQQMSLTYHLSCSSVYADLQREMLRTLQGFSVSSFNWHASTIQPTSILVVAPVQLYRACLYYCMYITRVSMCVRHTWTYTLYVVIYQVYIYIWML